jgi:hypothetical protein
MSNERVVCPFCQASHQHTGQTIVCECNAKAIYFPKHNLGRGAYKWGNGKGWATSEVMA